MPIRPTSLASQVYEDLRRRITEGRFAEDAPLVIASLVRDLGVSQTPVREALARLRAEGLASFTENIGFRVAQAPRSADYQHWMQARLVIEVSSMQLAAAVAQREDIDALQKVNDSIRRARFGTSFDGIRRFAELNAAFHRLLMVLGGNKFLLKAYDQIWLGAQFSRIHYKRGVVDQAQIAREHQAVIDALASRDVEATCNALGDHIADSLARDRQRRAKEPQSYDRTTPATGATRPSTRGR